MEDEKHHDRGAAVAMNGYIRTLSDFSASCSSTTMEPHTFKFLSIILSVMDSDTLIEF